MATYLPYPWPNKRAVGSCYCFDQAPSAERYAGLTVTLQPRRRDTGAITLPPSQKDWRSGRAYEPNELDDFAQWAEKGVKAAAQELAVDLSTLDVELSDFAIHDVDSNPALYAEAAMSAFQSAWDAWRRFYPPRQKS